jgi:hypothetical protein
MIRNLLAATGAVLVLGLIGTPSQALTMKECSAKYQDAKKANTLKGQKWNDFRKAECGDDDADESAASAAVKDDPAPKAAAPKAGATTPAAAPKAGAAPAATAAPKATGKVVFPKAVDKKYADQKPGHARLKTCADQYNANKAKDANGGLRWIQTGGGYWSECNKKLKDSGA